MTTATIKGIEDLILYKGKVCFTAYSDSNVQIFYTENCNAVFKKEENKVYEISIDAWTKLVLKLETILEN
jgi:hypothetical protein